MAISRYSRIEKTSLLGLRAQRKKKDVRLSRPLSGIHKAARVEI